MKSLGKTAIICTIIFFVFVISGGILFGIGVADIAIENDVINTLQNIFETNGISIVNVSDENINTSSEYDLGNNMNGTEIEIKNVCGNVTVVSGSDTATIRAEYSGPSRFLDNGEIIFDRSGDSLEIKLQNNISVNVADFSINSTADICNLTIYLPSSFHGDLDIKNAAGNVSVSGINISELEISDTVGEIAMDNTSVRMLTLESTVGEVKIFGEIGGIDISNNLGECTVESTIPFAVSSEIEDNLGEINITLPADARINVFSSNILGELSVDNTLESSRGVEFSVSDCLGEVTVNAK